MKTVLQIDMAPRSHESGNLKKPHKYDQAQKRENKTQPFP